MARELAHKVKGTAGSYGFDDISAGMQRIEERVDCLLEGSARDPAAVWAEIEHALARARDEVSTG
jgi:HPt (histidine-containing phosphotransfer) domain-containing protein